MNEPFSRPSQTAALSAFLSNLPELLQQPAALAVIASLGAHAVFFVLFPYFSASQDAPNTKRTVRVVELSPQEQTRLPQAPSASTPLAPLAGVKPDVLAGLPLPQPSTQSSPGQPWNQFPNLKIPEIPVTPPPIISFPLTTAFRPPVRTVTPPPPRFEIKYGPQLPPFQLEPVPAAPPAPTSPATSPSEDLTSKLTPNVLPNGSTPSSPPTTSLPPTTSSPPTFSPTPAPRQLATAQETQVAMQELQVGDTTVSTDQAAAIGSFGKWVEQHLTSRGLSLEEKDRTIKRIEVPLRDLTVRDRKIPEFQMSPRFLDDLKLAPAVVVALVDSEGKVVDNTAVMLSGTGRKFFNDQAKQIVEQQLKEIKPTGKFTMYQFEIKFQPPAPTSTTATS